MKKNHFVAKAATAIALTSLLSISTSSALASGSHGAHKSVTEQPKSKSSASNVIAMQMHDNYYSSETVTVKKGETVRFTVKNMGDLVHEFNIGTSAQHATSQAKMAMMVDHGVLEADKINHGMMDMNMGGGMTMQYNETNSVLLEPGQTKDVIWTSSETGTLEYACNIPGHYDAGMVGQITIQNSVSEH